MKKGFTLIELLVVVLIIGILSAVALPQYQKTVEKSRASEVYSYVSAWEKAQNVYRLENGTYTDDLENLSITLPELKYFTVNMKEHDTGGGITLEVSANPSFPIDGFSQIDVHLYESGNAFGSCWGDEGNPKCTTLFSDLYKRNVGSYN